MTRPTTTRSTTTTPATGTATATGTTLTTTAAPTTTAAAPNTGTATSAAGRIDGIHTIAVPVTDQDRALRFYTGLLGFEVRMDMPMPQLAGRWIEVAPAGEGTSVALIPASDRNPAGREIGIRFTTADAATLHRSLAASGVHVGELLTWPGVPPMFTVTDPDRNGFEIVQLG